MSTTRRTFLRTLALGLVAGPALVKAALKPTVKLTGGMTIEKLIAAKKILEANALPVYSFMGFEFIRTELGPLTADRIREMRKTLTLDQRITGGYRQMNFRREKLS